MKQEISCLSIGIMTCISGRAQITEYSVYGNENITMNGGIACVGGSFSNEGNVADSDLENFASYHSLVDLLGCGASVNVPLVADVTSGILATTPMAQRLTGFRIGASNLLAVATNATITTYDNNVPVETASGSTLLTLLLGGRSYIYMYATQPFNRVELTVTGLAGALTSIDYYYGFATADTFGLLGDPLSISMEDFSGTAVGNTAQLSWQLNKDHNVSVFYVEKSTNAKTFSTVGTLKGESGIGQYVYTDIGTAPGVNNYYRLRMLAIDGQESYSTIISIRPENGNNTSLTVYPNPARDQITINTPYSGEQNVRIIDLQGRTVWERTYGSAAGNLTIDHGLSGLVRGTYLIQVYSNTGSFINTQVIFQ